MSGRFGFLLLFVSILFVFVDGHRRCRQKRNCCECCGEEESSSTNVPTVFASMPLSSPSNEATTSKSTPKTTIPSIKSTIPSTKTTIIPSKSTSTKNTIPSTKSTIPSTKSTIIPSKSTSTKATSKSTTKTTIPSTKSTMISTKSSSVKNCTFSLEDYQLSWYVDSTSIHFDLQFKNFPTFNAWTAVGFGLSMDSGLDVIVVRVLNGKVGISDESVMGHIPPTRDPSQDVTVQSASLIHGTLLASFSRPLKATEPKLDYPLDKSDCSPFKFVYGPGTLDSDGQMHRHTKIPAGETFCLSMCRRV